MTSAQQSVDSPFRELPINSLPGVIDDILEDKYQEIKNDLYKLIESNDMLLLKYAAKNHFTELIVYNKIYNLITYAARHNNLDMVKYLHKELGLIGDNGAIAHAARHNNLDMVEYLRKEMGLTGDNYAIKFAAENNHLDMVKYLHKELGLTGNKWAMAYAIENNHLDVVKYLHEEMGITGDDEIIEWVAIKNHLEIAEYLISIRNELI